MRPCTTTLRNFLNSWSSATAVSVADLYTFTLITGEVFHYSGFQIPLSAPLPPYGTMTASAAIGVGTYNVSFVQTLPPWLVPGLLVYDQTNPTAIPPGTTVASLAGSYNINLSQAVAAPGISNGDTITFGAQFALGPRFARTKTKCQIGPQVDEMEADIYVGSQDMLGMNSGGNITWQHAAFVGLFDGAYCELLRAFLTGSPPTVVGTITWFYGRIGDVDVGRTKIAIRVKSLLDLLTVQMPRRLFQAACNHIFGEPGTGMCGYDRVNGHNARGASTGIGAQNITCATGSDQNSIFTTFVPGVSTSYDNGTIKGTSGLNNGFTRTIGKLDSSVSPSHIYFLKPFIFPVVAGTDTFQLLPGCDHTLSTCTNTFQNQFRFGGFPYIPPPETAV